ncbi:MAG: HEAT repeat domain-containing protein [Planctomycetes bacterium]|nr:HEAT repeat domain-containing protein [Planctomycetota bacterium]MBI3843339.1 HEAT repeat domain-containing protein [Planctomycetota bacterium]
MSDVLTKICKMLASGDAELQCAAARILGEIGEVNADVLKALHDALDSPNHLVASYALDAVARIHSSKSIAAIVPLLNGPEKVREKATEVLVGYGQAAGPVLLARLPRAGAEERRALMRALALVGGTAASHSLLESVFDKDPEVARAATGEIRAAAEKMEPADRIALAKAAATALSDKRARKNEAARASLARILGALGGPPAEKALVPLASPKQPLEVRRAALLGLEQMAPSGPGHDATVRALLPMLRESNWHDVVSHALMSLQRVTMPRAALPTLLKLVQASHPPVRRFAVEKLAAIDTVPVATALVKLLDHEDAALRDRAAASLARMSASTAMLVGRLAKANDVDAMWTAAKILKGQDKPPRAAALSTLRRKLGDWLRTGDRRADPLLYLFRHADPAGLEKDLLGRARAAKAVRKLDDAAKVLVPLTRIDPPPKEALLELAIVRIAQSPKDVAMESRRRDEGLALLERVLSAEGKATPLAKRLMKERLLVPDGLLYVGFHFAETLREGRDLGAQLLKHVAKRYARTAAGKAAKNKLGLEAMR